MNISLIIFIIGELLFLYNLLREIIVYKSIKSCFYCKHCSTFNEEISRISKCKQCKRTLEFKGGSWDHLILHRVNWIPANSKSEVFKWKEYRKLCTIELTINIIAIIIIAIGIISVIIY